MISPGRVSFLAYAARLMLSSECPTKIIVLMSEVGSEDKKIAKEVITV
jgi:hypothetical protein